MLAADGPPTTLSPTGVDRVAFLQGNLTRDATYFVNGSPVGARDIFVVSPCLLPRMPSICILDLHRVDSKCCGHPNADSHIVAVRDTLSLLHKSSVSKCVDVFDGW